MRKLKIAGGLLFLFAMFAYAGAFAQGKTAVSGAVTDTEGRPVAGALVRIKGASTGVFTDRQGIYRLPVPPGQHRIVVSMMGYETREADAQSGQPADVVLPEAALTLSGVQVYAKTGSRQVRESAFSANALNVRSFVNTSSSLGAIVNRTAGIRVREEGGVGSDFELSINGMSGNSVRYFIDGIPLSSKGSGVNLANLPVNLIERVEIYKGVVPAWLGADALGGAVNIITKQQRSDYIDASYGIGSFHTHKFDFNARYAGKRTGIIFLPAVGINSSRNDYRMKAVEVWNPGSARYEPVSRKRFHDDYFSLIAQLDAGVENRPWTDALFVSASYSLVNKDIQTGSVQSKVYGEASRESRAWNLSARYAKKDLLVKNLSLSASVSYTHDHSVTLDTAFRKYDWNGQYIEASRNEITGRSRSIRHYRRPMAIVRSNLGYRIGNHHILDLNYLLNRTGNRRQDDADPEFEPSNDVLASHNIGLSYSQSFLNEKLSNVFFVKNYISHTEIGQQDLYWLTGSRDVPASATKGYWGYGGAIRYAFREEAALKFSCEHSVRLPLARELLGNGTTVIPNVKLRPENSRNFNLEFYGSALHRNGHLLDYQVSGFIRNASDYIRAVISERDGLLQYDNVSSVFIKGVEGEMSYDCADRFHAAVNCSYQDARDMKPTLESGKPSITYKNRIPNRPWLFGNAEADLYFHRLFTRGDRLRIGYNYQYVHWFYLTWEAYGTLDGKSRIPTQHQHNLLLSYSWKQEKFNLSLECHNLFDKALYDNFMLQKPGRSFFCKLRVFIH